MHPSNVLSCNDTVDVVVLDLTNVRSRSDHVSDRVCFARFRGFSFAVGDYESNRE